MNSLGSILSAFIRPVSRLVSRREYSSWYVTIQSNLQLHKSLRSQVFRIDDREMTVIVVLWVKPINHDVIITSFSTSSLLPLTTLHPILNYNDHVAHQH